MAVADYIEKKAEDTRGAIAQLQRELRDLEAQKTKAANSKGIEAWLSNTFESSSVLTPEFSAFAREFKKSLLNDVSETFELVNWNRNHFGVSGFLKNRANGNLVYFSISDVRYSPGEWYEHILIRTAKHDRDYTGGPNCYTPFRNLKLAAIKLTG